MRGGTEVKPTASPYYDPSAELGTELNETEKRNENENDENDEYEESDDREDADDRWQTRVRTHPLVVIGPKTERPYVRSTKRSRTVQISRSCRNYALLDSAEPLRSPDRDRGLATPEDVDLICFATEGQTPGQTKEDEITLDDIDREYDLIVRAESERRENEKRAIEAEIDEISLAALRTDNRNFIKISINGRTFKALLDPGATLSLAGPRLAEDFVDKMTETNTRVRTATGNVTCALGNLPLTIEVEGRTECVVFRVIAELEQDLILGMDFCRRFDVDTRLGRGVWRACEGEWREFERDDQPGNETAIVAKCACFSIDGPTTDDLSNVNEEIGSTYNVGDLVLRRARARSRRDDAQLGPTYEGPFRIIEVRSPTIYVIANLDGRRLPIVRETELRLFVLRGNNWGNY